MKKSKNTNTAQTLIKRLSFIATLAFCACVCICVQLPEEYTEKYEVTLYSAGTGASGGGYYVGGKTVTIYAGTVAGKEFKKWTSTNSDVAFADAGAVTTTFIMPAGGVAVTAEFETTGGGGGDGSYTVNVESIGNGATGGGTYYVSQMVTVYAGTTPDGYRFSHWTASPSVTFKDVGECYEVDCYGEATTFTMISSNVTVTAVFERIYAVTVISAGTNASDIYSYAAGDTVYISAGTALDGKAFSVWTTISDNVTFAEPNHSPTSFIMPANAVTVTAVFVPAPTFAVTVIAGAGAMGSGSYWQGARVNISTGIISDGQRFINWTATPNVSFDNMKNATTTFIMPASAVMITAAVEMVFTDNRDRKVYKIVSIGGKMWMAENLDYDTVNGTGSWGSVNELDIDAKYGRLYNWNTAMAGSSSSTANPSGRRGVCPAGWHLPSRMEWGELAKYAGGTGEYGADGTAGTKLKSKTGWNSYTGVPIGTDNYGFSALPADCYPCVYNGRGFWWTATEYGDSSAYFRGMDYRNESVSEIYNTNEKSLGLSVRCVQND